MGDAFFLITANPLVQQVTMSLKPWPDSLFPIIFGRFLVFYVEGQDLADCDFLQGVSAPFYHDWGWLMLVDVS